MVKKIKKKPVKSCVKRKSKANAKQTKARPKAKKSSEKKRLVSVPTNKQEKLVDLDIMRKHEFMSSTDSMLTRIYPLEHVDGRKYEVQNDVKCVSAILKLVLDVVSTNELSDMWSLILWNISQQDGLFPDEARVTFTRVFERRDNDDMRKEIVRRRRLSILSSNSERNIKRQSAAVAHDKQLIHAIDSGDSVVSFGAEAIVTAPNEQILEKAVNAIKDYLKTNDETRGLKYELDINKQTRPFILYGPNNAVGNKDVYVDMTSHDAAVSALFVDAGGDRTPGSEYVGVSVGKLIRSHAAYNFQNSRSLFIGNDTTNITETIGGSFKEPSQIYLSKVVSRAYMLAGKSVTHFVADHANSVDALMSMPIYDARKTVVDVSKGLLNIMEAIDHNEYTDSNRLLSRFSTHLDNIIVLLSQFRDTNKVSTTDDFADITRDILTNFFVYKKYWSYDARNNIENVRLIGVRHEHYQTLASFGQYVAQRLQTNTDDRLRNALYQLNTIVNKTILPTIPALNTQTDPIVDKLVDSSYRVIDLTGTSVGAMSSVKNPSMNVMMISYLSLIIPTLKNGDVIFLHGFHRISSIADVINDMIVSSGLNVDIVYTESNQSAALDTMDIINDSLDFVAVDLYHNRVDKLVEPLSMDKEWSKTLGQAKATFFIKTNDSLDYIYLDNIL